MGLANFLRRNEWPFTTLKPEDDEAAHILALVHVAADEMPVAVLADWRALRRPSESELAGALGMVGEADDTRTLSATRRG